MKTKLIIEWLHRVLEEKTQDIDMLRCRISELNHQIQHFNGMQERYQKEVLENLLKDLENYDIIQKEIKWDTPIEQIKEQMRFFED